LKPENTGFLDGGFAVFTDELTRQEKTLLAPLESERKSTSDPARKSELDRQIAAIQADFKAKRKAAMYCLFGNG
jgi:hypothetical protein